MIQIDDKLISLSVFERKFVCDLNACKGACCVEGDMGAPLEDDEAKKLEEIYPKVKPFLRAEGIEAIEQQGTFIRDDYDEEYVTPLVNNSECAYVTFDANGTAKCGIEQAYRAGEIDYLKPVSCHLYPIRIKKYSQFTAVNYDEWDICKPACECGEQLNVPVFKFLKEPLIRKFGEMWYHELTQAQSALENREKD